MTNKSFRWFSVYTFLILMGHTPYSFSESSRALTSRCGPISTKETAGPYNYTSRDSTVRWHVRDVTKNHFLKAKRYMELPRPSSRRIHVELTYTLIRVPNHHRALYLLGEFHNRFPKEEFNPPLNLFSTAPECFFDRAMRYDPNDIYIHQLKAIYYHKRKRYKQSLPVYKILIEKYPDWGELHYNLGLLYMDMKDYEKALLHAKQAYKNNYTLPGLKNKLEKKGKWH